MPKQGGRRVGPETVRNCYGVLRELRSLATDSVSAPNGRDGQWHTLPEGLVLTAFANERFNKKYSTVRNWLALLAGVELLVRVGNYPYQRYFVRMDGCSTVAQLAALFNAAGNVQQPAEPTPVVPASMDLETAQSAGLLPATQALTGPAEHPPVSTIALDTVLEQYEQVARMLKELQARRAVESVLRSELDTMRSLIQQYEAQIVELTAELERARAASAVTADVLRKQREIEVLLDALNDDATE